MRGVNRHGLMLILSTLLPMALSATLLQAAEGHLRFLGHLELPAENNRLALTSSLVADPARGLILVSDWRHRRMVIFQSDLTLHRIIDARAVSGAPEEIAVTGEGFLWLLPGASRPLVRLNHRGERLGILEFQGLPDHLPAVPRIVSFALSPGGDTVYAVDDRNQRLWVTGLDGLVQTSHDLSLGLDRQEAAGLRLGHVDAYGEQVLVALPDQGQVLVLDAAGRSRQTVGRPGHQSCRTGSPVAAALDRQGQILMLDRQRAVVSVWDAATNTCRGEYAGPDSGDGALYRPLDMTLDERGRLLVSQGFDGRVQIYDHGIPAAGAPGNAAADTLSAPGS